MLRFTKKAKPHEHGKTAKRANDRDPTHMRSYYSIPILLRASTKCDEKRKNFKKKTRIAAGAVRDVCVLPKVQPAGVKSTVVLPKKTWISPPFG
jgi:hypothetical protein